MSDLRTFFYTMCDRGTTKRIYVENEYGWQLAIPVYSNNGDYGFHVISVVNVELLGASAHSHTGVLKQIINNLLPKLHIPGYLIEGHTRIFIIDKISGKFLKAKFNKWKNEAYLFFRAKVVSTKGLGHMPIMLRIAWILGNFFAKRAAGMRETVEKKGYTLYGTWVEITELLETISERLKTWVKKFADPSNWNSKKRYEAKQKAGEKAAREEERERKEEELKKKKPSVIADLLGKLAWLTDHDETVDKVWEIGEVEGVDVYSATKKLDRESGGGIICYG